LRLEFGECADAQLHASLEAFDVYFNHEFHSSDKFDDAANRISQQKTHMIPS
jgi:hypothetical protein